MKFRRARRVAGALAVAAALSGCGLGDDSTAELGNPCELLTSGDIQGAVGQPTQEGQRGPDNVCTWRTEGGGVFTLGIHPGGRGGFDSAIRASEGGTRPSGIGDVAFFTGNTQFAYMQILDGEDNLRLDYSGPGAPDEAKMSTLGRKAVEGN